MTLFIHELIQEQALLYPSKTAVVYRDQKLSYEAMNQKANSLAHYLITQGITTDSIIGISIERSPEIIIAILAILKTGVAYLPIDPEHPLENISQILNDSKAEFLITNSIYQNKFSSLPIKKIFIDALPCNENSITNPNINIKKDTLAYVLYTSGSTGNPKGVMICHNSLVKAYEDWKSVYKLTHTDSHLQMANFTFDVFTGDLIRALCSGAKLTLCPKRTLINPKKLYELLVEEKINCAEFVPTILRRLSSYAQQNQLSLNFMRLLICGSDYWSMNDYKSVQNLCSKKTRVINSYGLTETTIDSTYFETSALMIDQVALNQSVPIGKPFPNTEIFLLDNNFEPVPNGKIGEIYIGGPGLARGYLNNPTLTKEKFINHPALQKRLYKTGDLGQYQTDGNIHFLGRIDNQVKIRGMRIELSQIENTLNQHDSIAESLISVSFDENKEKMLVAYIVLDTDHELNISDIRKFLQTKLPLYMIPSTFIKLDALPVTSSGKLNRKLLTV